jgi:hypothetical protein
MTNHRTLFGGATRSFSLLVALAAGPVIGCAGTHAESKPPTAAAAAPAAAAHPTAAPSSAKAQIGPNPGAPAPEESSEDAELVVSREVIGACPKLRLVRQHVAELDPNTVWLAVLASLSDCMSETGPMAGQMVGVSGDEEHRHVVREVLGSRGVAPTRILAAPVSPEGAAECQGGAVCQRVEITIAPAP